MEIFTLLETLEDILERSKTLPFTEKAVIDKEEFFEICSFEIKKINKEIKEKEDILARYGMAIEKIKNPENVVTMLI